jgi:ParB/RepB/Spo0J family partition protein
MTVEVPLDSIRGFGPVDDAARAIRVRPDGDGCYFLLAGHRRFAAARAAGWTTVPVVIATGDADALVASVAAADLAPLDRAQAYAHVLAETGLKQRDLARRLGTSQPSISNALRLLRLVAEAQVALRANIITMAHAKALLALSEDEQAALLDVIIADGWSSKQTEAAVRAYVRRASQQDGDSMRRYSGEKHSPIERLRTLLSAVAKSPPDGAEIVTMYAAEAALRAAPDLLALYDAIDIAAPLSLDGDFTSIARIEALGRADEAMARLRKVGS